MFNINRSGKLNDKYREHVETLNHLNRMREIITQFPIDASVKLRLFFALWVIQGRLFKLKGMSRKRYRKRTIALRHEANRIVNKASDRFVEEINDALA